MSQLSPQEVAAFRSLKKTAIVLLILFRLDPRPVGPVEIAEILDIDRKPAAKYLDSLRQLGLVTRISYHAGYTLTQGGKQLVLGMDADLLPEPARRLGISSTVIQDGTGDFVPTGDFFDPATASDSLEIQDQTIQQQKPEAEAPQQISPVERRQALLAAGIRGRALDELAGEVDLEPDYIRGHDQMRRDRGEGTGMLITRLRDRDELPEKYLPAPICDECGQPRNRHTKYCVEGMADIMYFQDHHRWPWNS